MAINKKQVAAVEEEALRRLETFLLPGPDPTWRQDAHDWYSELCAFDEDAREALRHYGRTKGPAREVFASRNIRVDVGTNIPGPRRALVLSSASPTSSRWIGRLDEHVELFSAMPPSARVLYTMLEHGEKSAAGVLTGENRLPARYNTRGFVIDAFDERPLAEPVALPTLAWSAGRRWLRRRLTDVEIAAAHAYLFPTEVLRRLGSARGSRAGEDPGTRTAKSVLQTERRNIAKAREEWSLSSGFALDGRDGAPVTRPVFK